MLTGDNVMGKLWSNDKISPVLTSACGQNVSHKICHSASEFHKYCIAQNFGGKKLWRIWRILSDLPKFFPAKIPLEKCYGV